MTTRRLLSGMVAGLAGTAAMTQFMLVMHRRLPPGERYPLPPRQVTMAAIERVGLEPPDDRVARSALTLAGHFLYGVALAEVYALGAPRRTWAPAGVGLPFGLAVWTGSYLGWLPAAGLHRPATRESMERNALMIAAHLVWAGTLAAVVQLLDGRPHHRAR